MTVHRSQGQTLDNVEVDCASFFAPGQMGVAIGRAVCKNGLRVLNFNSVAANLKHSPLVYNFYERNSVPPRPDRSCCTQVVHQSPAISKPETQTPSITEPHPSMSSQVILIFNRHSVLLILQIFVSS